MKQKEKLVFDEAWDYVKWKRRNRHLFQRVLRDVSTGKVHVEISQSQEDETNQ